MSYPATEESMFAAKELFNFAVTGLCGLFFLRWLTVASTPGSLVVPLLYVYAAVRCPARSSFDVKKHVKRVLRGHHLPADHPRQAQGFFQALAARAAASVVTETVEAVQGRYRHFFWSLGGAAWLVTVEFPSSSSTTSPVVFMWIGIHGQWYYLTNSRRMEQLWFQYF